MYDIADTSHVVNDDLSCFPLIQSDLCVQEIERVDGHQSGDMQDASYTDNSPKMRLWLQAVANKLERRDFDLKSLPSKTFWKFTYGLKLPSTVLLYSFQFAFQRGNLFPKSNPSTRYVAKTAADWQVDAGLSPHEWPNAILGARELIEQRSYLVGGSKQTCLRPTETFMAVFGLTLADYDVSGRVLKSTNLGRPSKGKLAGKDAPLSAEENAAVERWTMAKGYWK